MDSNSLGFVLDVDSQQRWLSFPLSPRRDWMAVYRVTVEGEGTRRRFRVGELRIVPVTNAASFDFDPATTNLEAWEAQRREQGRRLPAFPFDNVRRWITQRHFVDAVAASSKCLPRGLWLQLPDRLETSDAAGEEQLVEVASTRQRIGRPPSHPPEFYAKFAIEFDRVEYHMRRREPGSSTRKILAEKHKTTVNVIGKWIRVARQKGFLAPVKRGRRGGRVLPAAKELLNKAKQQPAPNSKEAS